MQLICDLVTLILDQQLQPARHAAAKLVDVSQVSGVPLLPDELLQFLHRLREARVNARLQLAPEVLNGVEVRTPCWPLKPGDPQAMEIGDRLWGRVEARVVLLKDPR